MIEAVCTVDDKEEQNHDAYNLTGCFLILTEDILYIIDKSDDMLLRAFYLSQIDIDLKRDSNNVLVVSLNSQKVQLFLNEYQRAYENAFDRVVEYLIDSSKSVDESKLSPQTSNKSILTNLAHLPEYYKFSKLNLNNYLNSYAELTCVCGQVIAGLNKHDSDVAKSPNSRRLAETTILMQQSLTQTTPSLHQQQQFFYYVDPCLASGFISTFNSIKRRITNKGFQF
jgi:hypothetical protein